MEKRTTVSTTVRSNMAALPKNSINGIVDKVIQSKLSGQPITLAAIVSDILMKRHVIPHQQTTKLAYRIIEEKIQKIDSGAWFRRMRTQQFSVNNLTLMPHFTYLTTAVLKIIYNLLGIH